MSQIEVFRQRAITGIIFGLVVMGLILSRNTGMLFLLLMVQVFAFREFLQAFQPNLPSLRQVSLTLLSFLPFTLLFVPRQEFNTFILSSLSVFAFFLVLVMAFKINWKATGITGAFLLGIFIISLPVWSGFQLAWRFFNDNFLFLYVLAGIWTFDVFAYLSGVLFGRRLLLPTVSPKKTRAGTMGGAVFTFLIFWIFRLLDSSLSLEETVVLPGIIIVCGQAGDLAESVLKRQTGIKDSGTMLPGHGGIWDRFDSLLGVLPAVFLYYAFTQYF